MYTPGFPDLNSDDASSRSESSSAWRDWAYLEKREGSDIGVEPICFIKTLLAQPGSHVSCDHEKRGQLAASASPAAHTFYSHAVFSKPVLKNVRCLLVVRENKDHGFRLNFSPEIGFQYGEPLMSRTRLDPCREDFRVVRLRGSGSASWKAKQGMTVMDQAQRIRGRTSHGFSAPWDHIPAVADEIAAASGGVASDCHRCASSSRGMANFSLAMLGLISEL